MLAGVLLAAATSEPQFSAFVLRNLVTSSATWAVAQKGNETRSAGYAAGVAYTISTIENLLPQVAAHSDKTENQVGADLEYLESLAP